MDLPPLALSIRQPWAGAVAAGLKTIENRNWNKLTPGYGFRGAFAIHASAGMTQREYEVARAFMLERGVLCPSPDALRFGAIIGMAEIVDAHRKCRLFHDDDRPWFMGGYGLVIRNAAILLEPIPCIGALGFFDWQKNRHAGPLPEPKPWMCAWGRQKPAPAQIEAPIDDRQGRML